MTDQHALQLLARKYIWWLRSADAVRSPRRVIAQVMNIGTWRDVALLEGAVSRQQLEDALHHAAPGWFTGPSWTLWHLRLGLAAPDTIPPLPRRSFG